MEKNKSIWEKIRNWFQRLFGKQEQQTLLEEAIQEEIPDEELINDFSGMELDKQDFFETYSNIKNHDISLEELTTEELMEFNMMAEKEIEIKNQKIEEQKMKNKALKQEIEYLNLEEKRLQDSQNT